MDINNHVNMLNVVLGLILFCLFSNVGAQSSCQGNSITITNPVTGAFQCQKCLKCPSGEGLSVDCGDVISSKTPLVCKACVLGETFSAAYEAGACKDCQNCGDYRETKKNCTLTSKAVCGNCKPGAYLEPMLGMCKPCSPCCNDGNDIIVPECQVAGVSTSMQCSFLRSETCAKLIATVETDLSTTKAPPPPTTTPPPTKTTPPPPQPPTTTTSNHSSLPSQTQAPAPVSMGQVKQLAHPTNDPSPDWEVIGPAIAGALAVLILLAFVVRKAIRYLRNKRKQVCKKGDDDVEMQQVQDKDAASESDGSSSEADEPNSEDALLGKPPVPLSVQETVKSLLPTGVKETGESPLSTGIKETEEPGSQKGTDFTTVHEPRPEPCCEKQSHTKVHTTTTKTTVEETTCITCNANHTMGCTGCQLL